MEIDGRPQLARVNPRPEQAHALAFKMKGCIVCVSGHHGHRPPKGSDRRAADLILTFDTVCHFSRKS
jgi:hypothetical protein